MAIKRKKKKNGRVYLEEYKSVRIDGEIKSIYVRTIGPEKPVQKKPKIKPKILDRLVHGPSVRSGDVTLLWEIARQLNYVNIIDEICCGETNIGGPSPGKILTAWAINRALDPMSATCLEKWTPTTDLPRLLGVNAADFKKNTFLSALDFVCYEDKETKRIVDLTAQIDDALYRQFRKDNPLEIGETETLAYDLTSVLFFGVTCPLLELGYNPKHIKQRQVNLALVVTRKEKYPQTHFVYEGSRNSISTIKNLVKRLQDSSLTPGTLIWDRGMVSKNSVQMLESAHWHLICGVPKTSNEAIEILKQANVDYSWQSLVRSSKLGHIYATSITRPLYGRNRTVVVYANRESQIQESNTRNEALTAIKDAFEELIASDRSLKESELRKKAKDIVGDYDGFIDFRIRRKGNGPRLAWHFMDRKIRAAERMDGKWLLLSTDPSLSTRDVVNTYLEKDFIEKVFRTLKTDENLTPVRHRLESRVRGYMFVCVLAYRLLADLHYRISNLPDDGEPWFRVNDLLLKLGRVERVEVKLGRKVKTWYLNLSNKLQEILDKMGFFNLFEETIGIDLSDVGGKV
jgi:transposase